MANVLTATKAGFWIRVVATIIDGIILGIIGYVLGGILGGLGSTLSFIVGIAYYLYFWTSTGQTIGHKLLGLRVIRTDGSGLDVSRAIIRYVGEIVSALALCLGFIWVAFDANRQGWHDKIADTYVVKV